MLQVGMCRGIDAAQQSASVFAPDVNATARGHVELVTDHGDEADI